MTKFPTYQEAHERFKTIADKAIFYMFKVTVPLFTIPAMIQSYLKYFSTGDADTSFRLAFDAQLPYNWHTPITYLFTILAQLIAFGNSAAIYAISFIMFFGICTYLVALSDDVKQSLELLDRFIGRKTINYKLNLKLHFHKLIQFHARCKELSFYQINILSAF